MAELHSLSRQESMLNAINTKLLIAILAALAVIGSAVLYQRSDSAKVAATLQQQQRDAAEQRAHDEAFRKRVEQDRARRSSAAAHEGRTWKTYIP